MAAQIADRMNLDKALSPPQSKLEAARLEAAKEQQKRIEAAVARLPSKKSKRKSLEAQSKDEHRSKKSKTLVDVTPEADKKNSIARRLADRFSSMPEPEQEQDAATTRSIGKQQFVARAVTMDAAISDKTEVTTVKVVEKVVEKEETGVVSPDKEQPEETTDMAEWEGPTTNFHVKQLGLDRKVDIYKPIDQQQDELRRIRDRAQFLPDAKSIATLETASDSENDSDFAPNDVESDASDDSDTESLADVDDSETRALAEETEEYERSLVAQNAVACRTWAKRLFVYTPLAILTLLVIAFAALFVVDWSQETFQFCAVDAESAEASEELLSCASFVETQSLVKTTLREAAETLQSYLE